jgi:hypothetical protein
MPPSHNLKEGRNQILNLLFYPFRQETVCVHDLLLPPNRNNQTLDIIIVADGHCNAVNLSLKSYG